MKDILQSISQEQTKSVKPLIELIDRIRPYKKKKETAQEKFSELLELLEQDPQYTKALSDYIVGALKPKNFVRLFTDLGISSNDSFFIQTKQKFINKILPEVHDLNYPYHLLDVLFPFQSDYKWVIEIPDENWSKLFQLLDMKEIFALHYNDEFLSQILNSIHVVSIRINSLGLAQDILDKLPELETLDSPFTMQNREIDHFISEYLNENFDRSTDNRDYRHVVLILDQCDEQIKVIEKKSATTGVSLKLTNYLLRLKQNLKRIRFLLYLVTRHKDNIYFKEEVELIKELITEHCRRRSLKLHFEDHLSLISYQVTTLTGQTGESYITTTAKEYWKMFRAAAGGGVIVAFLSVFKLLIYYLSLPPFGNAFMNSMNYSLGFIGIHITKTKLATKQPAMTASRLAASLDDVKDSPEVSLDSLARMIKLIFRSQFAAFVGNVTLSLPVAFSLAWLWYWMTGAHLATPEVADHLVSGLHPWKSLVLFHAAIAGVYLFLSGLISGYYDNLTLTEKIPERLRNHPLLRRFIPGKVLVKLSRYIEKNLGQLAGNFFLGVFLGSTSTIGYILGLPLDIQHITFAAANLGVSIAGMNNEIPLELLIKALCGVGLIGLMNFSFSFGLSILVAIRSRNVNFKQEKELIKNVMRLFFKNPITFFIPPFKEDSVEYTPPSSEKYKRKKQGQEASQNDSNCRLENE